MYGTRPSQLIGLTRLRDEWLAFQYDTSIAFFGMWVEGKLSETDSKGRPKHDLEKLLADPDKPVKRRASSYRTDFSRFPVEVA